MDAFTKLALLSLDNDLATLVSDAKISVDRAMQLQMLRILRGRAFNVQLNAPDIATGVEGWSPDGVKWYPSEPGNSSTSGL